MLQMISDLELNRAASHIQAVATAKRAPSKRGVSATKTKLDESSVIMRKSKRVQASLA